MSGPSFTDLPAEILASIFSNFCLHCRLGTHPSPSDLAHPRGTQEQQKDEKSWYSLERQALYSSCLVSKRWRDIAQPILYHEFMPGFGDSSRSELYSWQGRLIPFLSTIARRRDLAAMVKWVYIFGWPRWVLPIMRREGLFSGITEEQAESVSKMCLEVLGASHEGYRLAFTQALRDSPKFPRAVCAQDGELLGLAIALLPCLERLSIKSPAHLTDVTASTLRSISVASLPLKTVDACDLASDDIDGILELAAGLTAINLYRCKSAVITCAPLRAPGVLRSLRLRQCRLTEEHLGKLLTSCRGLQTFEYEAAMPLPNGGCVMGYMDDHHFMPMDAIQHLAQHCQTLRVLHLDMEHSWGIWPPPWEFIRSLKEFVALEDLSLGASMICREQRAPFRDDDFTRAVFRTRKDDPAPPKFRADSLLARLLPDLLPANIASLRLQGCFGGGSPPLEHSLLGLAHAVSKGELPRLKRVRVVIWDTIGDFPGADLFTLAGIDCAYEKASSCLLAPLPFDKPPLPPRPQRLDATHFEPMPLPGEDSDDELKSIQAEMLSPER